MSNRRPIIITSPSKLHRGIAIAALLGAAIGIARWMSGAELTNGDAVTLLALMLASFYFFLRAAKPRKRVQFSPKGVWTRESGEIPWDDVSALELQTRPGYKGIATDYFVFHYYPANSEEELPVRMEIDLSDLSVNRKKLENILAGPVHQWRP